MNMKDIHHQLNEDEFITRFIYLTNSSRGKHCKLQTLRKAYREGTAWKLIKKLDPILYNSES